MHDGCACRLGKTQHEASAGGLFILELSSFHGRDVARRRSHLSVNGVARVIDRGARSRFDQLYVILDRPPSLAGGGHVIGRVEPMTGRTSLRALSFA